MKLSSSKRIESKALPGVAFTIRRINQRRREEIDEIIDPIAAKMPERQEYRDLCAERIAGKLSDEKEARWLSLSMAAAKLYRREVQPAIVRMSLVSIEGLDIDDQPATMESLQRCSDEADALYEEIVAAVEHERGLNGEETKNSNSPSTSGAPEGGSTESAAPAESAETITISAA